MSTLTNPGIRSSNYLTVINVTILISIIALVCTIYSIATTPTNSFYDRLESNYKLVIGLILILASGSIIVEYTNKNSEVTAIQLRNARTAPDDTMVYSNLVLTIIKNLIFPIMVSLLGPLILIILVVPVVLLAKICSARISYRPKYIKINQIVKINKFNSTGLVKSIPVSSYNTRPPKSEFIRLNPSLTQSLNYEEDPEKDMVQEEDPEEVII